jgi:pantoate--beta-alanine ligase
MPVILETIAALRLWREGERRAGRRVGLVPTMGALHGGHTSLVEAVRQEAESVVASIFVNPTQFAPTEDFSKYPRTFVADLEKLDAVRCDAVFAPAVSEMYPQGFATTVTPDGPAKVGLEDAFRPTHFSGVATVVSKLLLQALPDVAIFGEKDFQQLAVIRHVARDLDIPVAIRGGATIREENGLAMSSRNVYLSAEERKTAPVLYTALQNIANGLKDGLYVATLEENAMLALEMRGFRVDYIAVRDAVTLLKPQPGAAVASLRILAAATLGKTRLIDNIAAG